jgi:hypothetical protein
MADYSANHSFVKLREQYFSSLNCKDLAHYPQAPQIPGHRHIEPSTYLARGSEVGLNDIQADNWVEGYAPTALAVMFCISLAP